MEDLHMRSKLALLLAVFLVLPLAACQVRQTEEGELPEVEVQGGNMPEYDVDTADVEVTTREADVTVPDVDVTTEERTITVPDVNVRTPEENREEEAAEGEDPNR
jgi:uncharacterized lipoprotein